jgi:hypothetical protein
MKAIGMLNYPSYFSSLQATYESGFFRILRNKAFQPVSTCIAVLHKTKK